MKSYGVHNGLSPYTARIMQGWASTTGWLGGSLGKSKCCGKARHRNWMGPPGQEAQDGHMHLSDLWSRCNALVRRRASRLRWPTVSGFLDGICFAKMDISIVWPRQD